MVRLRFPVLALAFVAAACSAHAQVTWAGGFADDNFSNASNWAGGVAPLNDGTETLLFTEKSDTTLNLDQDASFFALLVMPSTVTQPISIDVTNSGHQLTIGSGGIYVQGAESFTPTSLTLDAPVVLLASQTWGIGANPNGSLTANGAISEMPGPFSLTLDGDDNDAAFILNSGASTFSGGVIVPGGSTTLIVGTSSTGPGDAPTMGPLGTGVLTLGDNNTLTTVDNTPSTAITIANTLNLGDATGYGNITFGGYQYVSTPTNFLTLTGTVNLEDDETMELDLKPFTVVTFNGPIDGIEDGVNFGTLSEGGQSVAILQGNLNTIGSVALLSGMSVILDSPSGNLQLGSPAFDVTSFNVGSNSYLGVGTGYSSPGEVASFISFLDSSGSSANFVGTLGFDHTSGGIPTFNDVVDLTNFNVGMTGVGSATSAILGTTAVIIPPGGSAGTTFPFGGGGGTLQVKSPLGDGTFPRNLVLNPGNAPLTLILSGALTYTSGTSVFGGALIFDTPPHDTNITLNTGYVGATANSGYSDGNSNIQAFVNIFADATGVVGFDAVGSTATVTSDIDMSGMGIPPASGPNLFLGTATSVIYSGNITPFNSQYQFSGVKGGSVDVMSTLGGSNSVVVGLVNPIESFNPVFGFVSQSSVTLSGTNSYTGGTTLNSGYLYVMPGTSLGNGILTVPGNSFTQYGGTLAIAPSVVSGVTLANDIALSYNGLALSTGGTQILQLTGAITGNGNLGIFGPTQISGDTSGFNGTVYIGASTVTVDSDNALGNGPLRADNSTLNFTSLLSPEITNLTLNGTTATFAGTPLIDQISLAQSTLNFNGTSAEIDNQFSDAANSGNVINLAPSTVLTFDNNGGGGSTFHGTITGGGSLVVQGSNSLELAGSNSYTGGTTIDSFSVVIASNNLALGTGAVIISPVAALAVNNGVTLTNPIAMADGGTLAGFGTFAPGGNVVIQNGSTVVPGRATISNGTNDLIPVVGKLSFGGGTTLTFGTGGIFAVAVADANGAAGTGYGTVDTNGATLDISATAINPFNIVLYSFDPFTNAAAPAANFNSSNGYTWTLVTSGGISGFSASAFTIDATTNFQNGLGTGGFYMSQIGNDLVLNFSPVPEPSTWALMATGVCALGFAVRRRRCR